MVKEIAKEELAQFPIGKFEGPVYLVEEWTWEWEADFRDFVDTARVLGIDTETKPAFRKGQVHRVSLLQLSNGDETWLFRLHKVGLPRTLVEVLESDQWVKVGIALHDDIRDLRTFKKNLEMHNVIDLNNLARAKGFTSIGAKKLTALLLGFTVSKRQQTSNWEAEELSDAQIVYAATDAWICNLIYDRLKEL